MTSRSFWRYPWCMSRLCLVLGCVPWPALVPDTRASRQVLSITRIATQSTDNATGVGCRLLRDLLWALCVWRQRCAAEQRRGNLRRQLIRRLLPVLHAGRLRAYRVSFAAWCSDSVGVQLLHSHQDPQGHQEEVQHPPERTGTAKKQRLGILRSISYRKRAAACASRLSPKPCAMLPLQGKTCRPRLAVASSMQRGWFSTRGCVVYLFAAFVFRPITTKCAALHVCLATATCLLPLSSLHVLSASV